MQGEGKVTGGSPLSSTNWEIRMFSLSEHLKTDVFIHLLVRSRAAGTSGTWFEKSWIQMFQLTFSNLASITTTHLPGLYWHNQQQCGNYPENLGKKNVNHLDFLLSIFRGLCTLLEHHMSLSTTSHHNHAGPLHSLHLELTKQPHKVYTNLKMKPTKNSSEFPVCKPTK